MSKEFEERVLQKLDNIEKQVEKIPEIEKQVEKIPEIEKQVAKIPEIEKQVAKIPEIEKQVAKIPQIEKQVAKIPQLEKQINRMPEMEDKINNMNRVLILLESEFKDKVPALFDAYSSNYQLQKDAQNEIDSLKQGNFDHSVRISNLEIAVEKNSKKLKKLIS